MQSSLRRIGLVLPLLVCIVCSLLVGLSTGCATRLSRNNIVNRSGVEVDLVREVKLLTTQPRGFEHPAIVSKERLTHILNSVEVETREETGGLIRQPAFDPQIVGKAAEALSEGLAAANPDTEVGVSIVRKQMRLGVFHRKFLTTFLAYIQDGYLYLDLNRVDWPIPRRKEDERLPKPRHGHPVMNFRVVSGELLFFAGPQTLEIAWQDPVFRSAYRLPGSTSGEKRRREIILESPIPKEEFDAAAGAGSVGIDSLSPDQLRALADLEEDRRNGRITETAYQRARRQLLRER